MKPQQEGGPGRVTTGLNASFIPVGGEGVLLLGLPGLQGPHCPQPSPHSQQPGFMTSFAGHLVTVLSAPLLQVQASPTRRLPTVGMRTMLAGPCREGMQRAAAPAAPGTMDDAAVFVERFLPREMDILATVNHRSIIKTYEIFETSGGRIYIIMELGVQGDLLEFIKCRGALHEDVARKMFRQLSSAVKYCHDLDVVHRDLKCENILLDKDFNIKLSDFGFSKRCLRDGSGRTVLSKTFCGSAAYAAPEVLQLIPYQPKAYDIWSLGVILYIMVCGSMPYDDSDIKKMLRIQKEHRVDFPRSKNLTGECKDLIYRMLQPDVNRRLNMDEILSHSWLQPPKPKAMSSASFKREGEGKYRAECKLDTRPGSRPEHRPDHKLGAKPQHRMMVAPENEDRMEERLAETSRAKDHHISGAEVEKAST